MPVKITSVNNLQFYRGSVSEEEFKDMSESFPRMTSVIREKMHEFLVQGKRLSSLEGISKQAAHRRAVYYVSKSLALNLIEKRTDFIQLELF